MSNFNFNMSVCGQLFYFKHILLDNRFKVTLKSHLYIVTMISMALKITKNCGCKAIGVKTELCNPLHSIFLKFTLIAI